MTTPISSAYAAGIESATAENCGPGCEIVHDPNSVSSQNPHGTTFVITATRPAPVVQQVGTEPLLGAEAAGIYLATNQISRRASGSAKRSLTGAGGEAVGSHAPLMRATAAGVQIGRGVSMTAGIRGMPGAARGMRPTVGMGNMRAAAAGVPALAANYSLASPTMQRWNFDTIPTSPHWGALTRAVAQYDTSALAASKPDTAPIAQHMLDAAEVMISAADAEFAGGDADNARRLIEDLAVVLDVTIWVGMAFLAPELSIVRSIAELAWGKNIITGVELTNFDRALEVVNIVTLGTFKSAAGVLQRLAARGGRVGRWAHKALDLVRASDESVVGMLPRVIGEASDAHLQALRNSLETAAPRTWIPKVLEGSRSTPPSKRISRGLHSLDKKVGRAGREGVTSPFGSLERTQEAVDHAIVEILESPVRTDIKLHNVEVYDALGRGVRLRVTDQDFVTFIELGRSTL